MAAGANLVSCDIQVDTLPSRGPSGLQHCNPLAVNRFVKRQFQLISWILNLGCAMSLELATENETPLKAKKQASQGTAFNDDDGNRIMDYDLRVCICNIRTFNRNDASAQLAEDLIGCGATTIIPIIPATIIWMVTVLPITICNMWQLQMIITVLAHSRAVSTSNATLYIRIICKTKNVHFIRHSHFYQKKIYFEISNNE